MRIRKKRHSNTQSAQYLANKEAARLLVHTKLLFWNEKYKFSYNRVAIRNTKRNWGSCTSRKNLNFNYKILFLPTHLQDYIVVHELCHLQELNHQIAFWDLVARTIPTHRAARNELRAIERQGIHNRKLGSDSLLSAVRLQKTKS